MWLFSYVQRKNALLNKKFFMWQSRPPPPTKIFPRQNSKNIIIYLVKMVPGWWFPLGRLTQALLRVLSIFSWFMIWEKIYQNQQQFFYDTSLAICKRPYRTGSAKKDKQLQVRPQDPQILSWNCKNKIYISKQCLINRTIVAGAVLQTPWLFNNQLINK